MGKVYTEAQKRASQKYRREKMDTFTVSAKKGIKERWRAAAEKQGKSLNRFIIDAVEAEIARDDLDSGADTE